jgi:hypothetical protein
MAAMGIAPVPVETDNAGFGGANERWFGVGAPLAGLFTYGEIARSRGVNAVHSQTLAALALG